MMSVKLCSYKDCENCTVGGVPCGHFTLFQFPKDPERRNQWIEMGKVEPSASNALLMCSQHFDRKFFSINQRRTILVGAAVPFPYDQASVSEAKSIAEIDELPLTTEPYEEVSSHGAAVEAEEMYEVELDSSDSPKSEDDYELDVRDAGSNIAPIKEMAIEFENDAVIIMSNQNSDSLNDDVHHKALDSGKRKRKHGVLAIADGKRRKSMVLLSSKESSNRQTLTKEAEALKDGPTNGHNETMAIVDSKHVTTFIFKSEEYVQMPKLYYMQEKAALLRQIKKYQTTISRVKYCLDHV